MLIFVHRDDQKQQTAVANLWKKFTLCNIRTANTETSSEFAPF